MLTLVMILGTVTPLPPSCPWASWTRPNLQWCEENLCAYVTAPANTYSNAAYIIGGIWMVREAQKRGSSTLGVFGPGSIIVGVTSAMYHASYTWFFQFFDFFGMYIFILMPLSLNLRRLDLVARRFTNLLAFVLLCQLMILTLAFHYADLPIQAIVAVLIVIVIAQEALIYRRRAAAEKAVYGGFGKRHVAVRYRPFLAGILFLLCGAVCSIADKAGIWCDPTNHVIQGHAVWHVLTAVSLLFIFHFYAQFALDKGMPGPPLVI